MARRVLARNIVEELRSEVSPKLLAVLVGLADYQSEQRQQITQLANLLNDVVDQFNNVIKATGVLKAQLKKYEEHLPKGLEPEASE